MVSDFQNLTKVLNDYGSSIVELYKRELVDGDINASNNLYNSVKYIVEKDNGKFEVNIELMDYWKYVSFGRKSGKFPPINKIEEWIKIKPVLPRPMANGKLPTTKQLAFLISRSIADNGIEPKPILRNTLKTINSRFLDDIEEAVLKDIGIQAEIIFKELG